MRRAQTALATVEELRGAYVPKQLRSVDTLNRIAIAGRELFLERDYEQVAVGDIAARAGISVGAFYTKFPSKERLVAFLVADLAAELRERIAIGLDPARWTGTPLHDIIGWYVDEMAKAFVRYRGLLRPATILARQTDDEELRAILKRFNLDVHGRFRTVLLESPAILARLRTAVTIDVMILTISSALREVLLYGEPVSRLSPGHREIIHEVKACAVAYLTCR